MIWNPNSYHIELTNACVAKCPFCARTKNNGVPSHEELRFVDIKKFFTAEVLKNTHYVNLCGAYGDPIYAKDFLDIVSYFTDHGVRVLVSTNGYNNIPGFWERLGNIQNLKITFGIDGATQKTHGNYRRGTKLIQVLKNANRYTKKGGNAVWQFLLFGNNEHEVARARELSVQLGFQDFVVRDSRAYSDDLPAPKISVKKHFVDKPANTSLQIDCEYESRKEWYINAFGQVLPCCYLGDIEYDNPVLRDSGMNIRNHNIKHIISRAYWKTTIGKFVDGGGNNICKNKCSRNGNIQRYSVNSKQVF